MKCKDELDACQDDTSGTTPDGGPAGDGATWMPPPGWQQPDMGTPPEDRPMPGFDVIRPPEDMVSGTDTVTPPPDVPRGSDLTCGQLLACINGCGDQACADDCYSRATPEAQATYDTASACVSNNCPLECLFFGGAVCDLCVQDMCSAETGACQ
jgi:hypothetical protein